MAAAGIPMISTNASILEFDFYLSHLSLVLILYLLLKNMEILNAIILMLLPFY